MEFNVGVQGKLTASVKTFNISTVKEILRGKTKKIKDYSLSLLEPKKKKKAFYNQITIQVKDHNLSENKSKKPYKVKIFRKFSFQIPGLKNKDLCNDIIGVVITYFNSFADLEFKINSDFTFKINMANTQIETHREIDLYELYKFIVNTGKIKPLNVIFRPPFSNSLLIYSNFIKSSDLADMIVSKKDIIQITILIHHSGIISFHGSCVGEIKIKTTNLINSILKDFDSNIRRTYKIKELKKI